MIAIAIDDEPIALDIIKSHAGKVPFIELKGTFTNAFEALAYLQKNPVDLLFLDIKMPDISGIDFLSTLANPPMVIFTTAYSEHAVKSFELDAVDYLLKPFALSRFLKACNKAQQLLDLRTHAGSQKTEQSVFIKDGYEQVRVQLDDILYIEAGGNYTQVHLVNGKSISTRLPIQDMLLMLPPADFIRTHRAFIVSRNKISRYDRYQVWIGETMIPISAGFAKSFPF
ncbi:DNA-binding response regulator [Pedobacter yulinensis]|uniref:DNA-binding response regulator n=1 Tax=Pedobacter yulinensis TaxID=2126353 RepID=A0A2T3HQ53_9SPHI|nr:LytTR family DNA-binding domain-containing protein [Pedobacter yulinensis]PST84595.1 DNA-binding response regulator [Pedobacter yulinensis]